MYEADFKHKALSIVEYLVLQELSYFNISILILVM